MIHLWALDSGRDRVGGEPEGRGCCGWIRCTCYVTRYWPRGRCIRRVARDEARARAAFVELKGQWGRAYSSAVGIIERALDSLLRFYRFESKYWPSLRTTNPIERLNKKFKRRTKAMEITGGEHNTYRLLAYVALTMNLGWRSYALSLPKPFYTLKAT